MNNEFREVFAHFSNEELQAVVHDEVNNSAEARTVAAQLLRDRNGSGQFDAISVLPESESLRKKIALISGIMLFQSVFALYYYVMNWQRIFDSGFSSVVVVSTISLLLIGLEIVGCYLFFRREKLGWTLLSFRASTILAQSFLNIVRSLFFPISIGLQGQIFGRASVYVLIGAAVIYLLTNRDILDRFNGSYSNLSVWIGIGMFYSVLLNLLSYFHWI